MAAAVTGSKTCTNAASPSLSAATLTALLATAPENLTIAELKQLNDAVKHISGGHEPTAVIGTLLT